MDTSREYYLCLSTPASVNSYEFHLGLLEFDYHFIRRGRGATRWRPHNGTMKSYFKEAFQTGIAVAKRNAIAGVILQIFGIAFVFGYYNINSIREFLDTIGVLKTDYSPWFAIGLTSIFGGVIPLTIESFQRRKLWQKQRPLSEMLSTIAFWAFRGAMVSFLYEVQAQLFGNDKQLVTVIKKVLFDQFAYLPTCSIPITVFFFLWRDCQFSFSKMKKALQYKGFFARAIPLMISNWSVWIFATSIIYNLPLPLQIILMNLVLVFWSLMLTLFVETQGQGDATVKNFK